jgi:putative solute:sodium symporter small subunit
MQGYWRKNVTIMIVLLAIWAFVGLGCGVLFADWLNQFSLGGFPLGFWFAQQGSIIVFILLILIYAILLNRLDNEYAGELEEQEITATAASADGNGEPEE